MSDFDPVNNRDDYKRILEKLSDWSGEISFKDFIDALAKKKDITALINKMNMYESYVEQQLQQWDLASTPQQRKVIIDNTRKQDFKGVS